MLFRSAVQRILAACKANGKMSMIFTGSSAEIAVRLEEGFDNILCGLDVLSLIRHCSEMKEEMKRYLEQKEGR